MEKSNQAVHIIILSQNTSECKEWSKKIIFVLTNTAYLGFPPPLNASSNWQRFAVRCGAIFSDISPFNSFQNDPSLHRTLLDLCRFIWKIRFICLFVSARPFTIYA